MTTIVAEPLSAGAFAPFGDVLETSGDPDKIINQGLCGRYHDRASMDFGPEGRAGISLFDAAIDVLDSAITTIRTNAATLGSNVSLLQTRLDFTTQYVNTLTGGSDKLTLADLNEEGANLVALQTRQQLATQALAFAGQAEQAVLQLFT